MSSKRYFLANNMKPFMGLLGLSQSFSFLVLAGEGGGGVARPPVRVGPNTKADPELLLPVRGRGDVRSSPPTAEGEENSKRLKRSQRSGVRMASGWLGGRQVSPTNRS